MVRLLDIALKGPKRLGCDERGITGLDAALITIAFVVVASVFAFTALTTGLFTTDRAKETVTAGLAEARGTMVLKGNIVATAAVTGGSGTIDSLNFLVTNAAAGEPIDMTVGTTIIRYTDKYQTRLLNQTGDFTAAQIGSGDDDSLMEPPEAFEINIPGMVSLLATDLGADQTFTIEVIPPRGAVLFVQRTLPISLELINPEFPRTNLLNTAPITLPGLALAASTPSAAGVWAPDRSP